ncbi:neutral zinc metallopeptidase [Biformimicrobium ophioploci]|uniref:Neutral zinc metallopeptidase n=2 Tax=Biformimicrobium ophioploci TaxID=3036711 RepID=A0ABQ6LWJ9_9GAMM|nr:neutral zinc metallopeptidase [Microbulbifer sp. NKW57]
MGRGNLIALLPLLFRFKSGWLILLVLGGLWFFKSGGFGNLFGPQHADTAATGETAGKPGAPAGPTDEVADFVSVILADTEDTWGSLFKAAGSGYRAPTLVLYDDRVMSACGLNSAAVGPFYCPGDAKVYLDLDFLGELRKMGAPGDFAFAYVIAHEIGHHVQNLLGTSAKVQQMRMRADKATGNRLSVMLELQADCFAGVWAHHAQRQRQILEPGDLEEGLRAATAVGDDTIMRRMGRGVMPDAFTHGSAEQRSFWFRKGLASGDVNQCDTFAAMAGLKL